MQPDEKQDQPAAARAKILLVDDEPHVRFIMNLKLKNAGYDVHTAADGEDGFAAAKEISPDAIVSDFQMPKMNGLQMCQALFNCEATKHIPVLLLTSREFEMTPERLAGTNVKTVRDKPFSPVQIMKVIETLLAAKTAAA